MGSSAIIISSDDIRPECFIAFLKTEGAFNPDSAPFPGRVLDGFKHIRVGLALEPMSDMTERIERELASSLLRPAKTAIIIEMSSNEGTARLAIDFAIKF